MKKISLPLIILFCYLASFSQKTAVPGWHTKDFQQDGFYGISLNKAYAFLNEKKLTPVPVIAGILDSGIDTTHEDLIANLWTNKRELPGNKKDDDNNGYADDVHGWNFLGNADGRNVVNNSSEWIRVYWRYKNDFEGKQIDTSTLSADQKYAYTSWQKARSGVVGRGPSEEKLDTIRQYVQAVVFCDSIFKLTSGKTVYSTADINNFKPKGDQQKGIRDFLKEVFGQFQSADVKSDLVITEVKGYLSAEEAKSSGDKVPPQTTRKEITGDDDTNAATVFYGNTDIAAGETMHGTHVAGIIGAVRNNKLGMEGIADKVELLAVRTTPEGDEYDKDIATGIRYAVDNGAKVINMSFGKSLSPDKRMIDEAVRYAASKDVLLIQAAGNSKRDISYFDNYPNPKYLFTDSLAPNWITVGASDCNGNAASFSNYGATLVDVFSPGAAIYSTVPFKDKYMNLDGTSMAAPVVTGVAALLRSYFPKLTAVQVKKVIEQSVLKPEGTTSIPGTDKKVKLGELCKSGGIVNAYEAVKLAYSFKN